MLSSADGTPVSGTPKEMEVATSHLQQQTQDSLSPLEMNTKTAVKHIPTTACTTTKHIKTNEFGAFFLRVPVVGWSNKGYRKPTILGAHRSDQNSVGEESGVLVAVGRGEKKRFLHLSGWISTTTSKV